LCYISPYLIFFSFLNFVLALIITTFTASVLDSLNVLKEYFIIHLFVNDCDLLFVQFFCHWDFWYFNKNAVGCYSYKKFILPFFKYFVDIIFTIDQQKVCKISFSGCLFV